MVYPYADISSIRISKRMAMMRSERVYRGNSIETEPNSRILFIHPVGVKCPVGEVLGKVLEVGNIGEVNYI